MHSPMLCEIVFSKNQMVVMNEKQSGRQTPGRSNVTNVIVVVVLMALEIQILGQNQGSLSIFMDRSNNKNKDDEESTAAAAAADGAKSPYKRLQGPKTKPINQALSPLAKMPQTVEEVLQMILNARNKTKSRATFVQIGANDGVMFDPLYPFMKDQKHKWIGLQVEPQPELYSSLAVLHADAAPDWSFYHGALASKDACPNGTISFCETKTPGVGTWHTQGQVNRIVPEGACPTNTMHLKWRPCVTSFEELVYHHASPAFLKHVLEEEEVVENQGQQAQGVEEQVVVTLQRRFNIDMLQIDVEGKDFEVLKLINWDLVKPVCVRYEVQTLKLQKQDGDARSFMQRLGYNYMEDAMDATVCRVVSKSDRF